VLVDFEERKVELSSDLSATLEEDAVDWLEETKESAATVVNSSAALTAATPTAEGAVGS
jgi:hypothetical protein